MEGGVIDKEPQGDELLTLVRQQFEEYADATIASRALAEKCRDYRDGKQWTEEERAVLKRRKQPCITDNKIQDKCDTLLGIEKQMRTDPRAFPRNPQDEESAEAATDALRFVADQSDFNRSVRRAAADNLMVEGLCAGQVIVEPRKRREPKVCMQHIRWDRVYYDVHSLRDDFADKTYCGFFTWMDFEQAKLEFDPKRNKLADKDALEHLEASFSHESAAGPDQTHDDKPRYILRQGKRRRVQVFEHYVKLDGVWHTGKWCRGGWLEPLRPSPYKDEDGNPDCCIEIQALYRDRDGNPYGLVQRYLDLQDEHNKRRSKMLHLLNAKRVILEKGTVEDINALRSEIHKPDGVIEIAGDPRGFRIEDNLAEAQGQWQLLQQTELALSQTGPNAALAGQSGNISGRAKQLDQLSGSLPITPLFEALEAWELRMFRQAWNRIRQYWTAEMWIRVTDDENKVRFVGLNQPVLVGDQLARALQNEPIPPELKQAVLMEMAADPAMRQPALDESGQPIIKNAVAQMDVDIIIDRTADVVNIQQEQFAGLLEIAKVRPEVPFDVLIEASQLRSETKKRVLERLKGANDPAAAQLAQLQQRLAELEAALKEAQVIKTLSEAEENQAQAQKIQAETVVGMAQAITPPDPKPQFAA